MCSGRVDLELVLQAFLNGADGVFIGGCRLNECNYTTGGNYDALNMVLLCKRIMEHIGLNPARLRIEFMTSGDGILFAEIMNEFGKEVKKLGRLGEGEGIGLSEVKARLEEMIHLVPYIKMVKNEKLGTRLKSSDEYDGLFTIDEVAGLLSGVVSYYIDPVKCQACGICVRKCPVEAIEGGKNLIHIINQKKCLKCGTCFESCPPRFTAIKKIVSEPVPDPIPEEARILKRKAQQ
jgi:coenzyme F420-reducing hydrogenase delta subunit/ferredoxin